MSSSDKYRNHPWDRARRLRLKRPYFLENGNEVDIDPGINYFILQIERLGNIQTLASCEGHFDQLDEFPPTFYLLFNSLAGKAHRIAFAGQILGDGYYEVHLSYKYSEYVMKIGSYWRNERHKRRVLRTIAKNWDREFGSLFRNDGTLNCEPCGGGLYG